MDNKPVNILSYMPPATPSFRNQRVILQLLGTGLMVLFVLCVVVTAITEYELLISFYSAKALRPDPEIAVILPLAAVVLGSFSFGLIGLRRWIRPVVIVFSTFACLASIFIAVASFIVSVDATGIAGLGATLLGFACAFQSVVLLPILIYFHWTHVRKTLEFYDQTPRWIDQSPIEVLMVTFCSVALALLCLLLLSGTSVPFFGRLISGFPKVALLVCLAGLFTTVAIALWNRKRTGLLLLAATLLVLQTSVAVSAITIDIPTIAAGMGFSDTDLELIRNSAASNPFVVIAMSSAVTLVILVYCSCNRAHFEAFSHSSQMPEAR